MSYARFSARTLVPLLASLALGCASAQPELVPIAGQLEVLAKLSGEWVGTYEADQHGRNGSILFRLSARGDTARGDVLMIQPGENLITSFRELRPPEQQQLLAIRFVRVSHNGVAGSMEPYRDPVCGCLLLTSFTGTVTGNSIAGEYRSEHVGSPIVTTGRWQVSRRLMTTISE